MLDIHILLHQVYIYFLQYYNYDLATEAYMAMSSVYRGDYCPGGKCDNAGALQKVSLVPRLVVPSFQDDGFHCSVQNKLCRRWDYLP